MFSLKSLVKPLLFGKNNYNNGCFLTQGNMFYQQFVAHGSKPSFGCLYCIPDDPIVLKNHLLQGLVILEAANSISGHLKVITENPLQAVD